MTTEQAESRKPIRRLNAHMKIGLFTGAAFFIISQMILFVVLPANPPHADVWLNVGFVANLMMVSSVFILVVGILERRFGKR